MGLLSAGAITFKGVMTGGLGLLIATAAIAGMFALVSSLTKKQSSEIQSIQDGAFDVGGNIVASGPENSIKLTRLAPTDQAVVGTNLFGEGGNETEKLLRGIHTAVSDRTFVKMNYSGFDAVKETDHHGTSFR